MTLARRGNRRQWIALILSGIFPGFGQFYLRAWGKGTAFLIAGAAATWGLERLVPLQDLMAGFLPQPGATLGALLALLGVYLWSMADAWVTAGRPRA